MSAHLIDVDPMTRQWAIYERTLRDQYAAMNEPAAKLDRIMATVRDAYLRCAPCLEPIPECPPEVHRYVFDVTLRLLGQVAKQEAKIWEVNALLQQGFAAAIAYMDWRDHG